MSDEPNASRSTSQALADALGVPVVAISALRRWNIEKLQRARGASPTGDDQRELGAMIEAASPVDRWPLAVGRPAAPANGQQPTANISRGIALSFLAGDDSVRALLPAMRRGIRARGVGRTAGRGHRQCAAGRRRRPVDALLEVRPRRSTSAASRPGSGASPCTRCGACRSWPACSGSPTISSASSARARSSTSSRTRSSAGSSIPWPRRPSTSSSAACRSCATCWSATYGVITMALTYAIAIILPVVVTFFIALRHPGGLGLPAAPRGDAAPHLPAHGTERQGRAADGPRPGLRHHGHPDHAHPGDEEGAR